MKIHGQLEKALIENLTADPTGAGLVAGRMWYRTDTKRFKVYDGASIQEFVDLASAQTLQNKILQGAVVSDYLEYTQQAAAPATPSAGQGRMYQKTDGKFYYVNADGVEQPVGSGAGGGSVNFIENGAADVNTDGWATYKDAAQNRPVDGDGGVPSVTFTRSLVSPLTGDASFIFDKPAGNLQGEGVSYDFVIDDDYKAKVLDIDISYLVNSGTFVAGDNTTESDVIVYLYDIDNGVTIEPSSIKLLSNHATLSAKFRASFQTPYDSNNYRLIFHVASTSTDAYSLKIDEVAVSPSNYVYGTPITDWVQTTYTGTWGNTNYNGFERRVGDTLEGQVYLTFTAAPTGGDLEITLPAGRVIDVNKIVGTFPVIGHGTVYDVGSSEDHIAVKQFTSTTIGPKRLSVSGAEVRDEGAVTPTNPAPLASGDAINFMFKVPIQGWSSSVQMSQPGDNRAVVMRATGTPSGGLANGVQADVVFGTTAEDTHGGYNPGTGYYTVPVADYYDIEAMVYLAGSFANNGAATLIVMVNGSQVAGRVTRNSSGSGDHTYSVSISGLRLKAGDVVNIDITPNGWSSVAYSGGVGGGNQFSVVSSKVSGTIAASEKVFVEANSTTGTVIGTTQTLIPYNNIVKNSHGTYSAGVFTAPKPGMYDVFAAFQLTSQAAGQQKILSVFKNGSLYRFLHSDRNYAGGADDQTGTGSTSIYLLAGETLSVRGSYGPGGGTLSGAAASNYITIKSQ